MKIYLEAKVKMTLIQSAVRAASVRIAQQSDELGTVSVADARRIIWEEIDKRLEAKP